MPTAHVQGGDTSLADPATCEPSRQTAYRCRQSTSDSIVTRRLLFYLPTLPTQAPLACTDGGSSQSRQVFRRRSTEGFRSSLRSDCRPPAQRAGWRRVRSSRAVLACSPNRRGWKDACRAGMQRSPLGGTASSILSACILTAAELHADARAAQRLVISADALVCSRRGV